VVPLGHSEAIRAVRRCGPRIVTDALAALLLVLPLFDWTVAAILAWLAVHNPTILTLRERAFAAVMLAFVATVAAVLAFVRFGVLTMPNGVALTLIALALVAVSVPAMVWLFLLVTGRFRLPKGNE
jgi:hypothetical protein